MKGRLSPQLNISEAIITVYEVREGYVNPAGRTPRPGWWFEVNLDGHRESMWTSGGERNAWAQAMTSLGRKVA